jgi:mono/diheme cytochrome c family protein
MRRTWIWVLAVAAAVAFCGQADAAPKGAAIYNRCLGCHKPNGAGIPGVFPPLAGNAAKLAKGDRALPVDVILFGLKGEIQVGGKQYHGTIPAYGGDLKDGDVAAVLNFILSSWGNDKLLPAGHKPYTAAEVRKERARNLSSGQVHEAREKLSRE